MFIYKKIVSPTAFIFYVLVLKYKPIGLFGLSVTFPILIILFCDSYSLKLVTQLIYFNSFFMVPGGKKFSPVTTFLPVCCSNCSRASFAIFPPFLLAFAFSYNPFASSVSAICLVDSSAKAVNMSSASLMWSRRF